MFLGINFSNFDLNKEIFISESAIPTFLTYFTQKKIKYEEFPKKYLLYCPNTIRKNTEKNEFESLTLFEIIGISRSEKCDEFHQEIFEDMRDLYSEINIKTRFFLTFSILYFYISI